MKLEQLKDKTLYLEKFGKIIEFKVNLIDKEKNIIEGTEIKKTIVRFSNKTEEQILESFARYKITEIADVLFLDPNDVQLEREILYNKPQYRDFINEIKGLSEEGYFEDQEKNVWERVKAYAPDNQVTKEEIEKIIKDYKDKDNQLAVEKEFFKSNENGNYFARIDINTEFGDLKGYFKENFYHHLYISSNPIGKYEWKFLYEPSWKNYAGLYSPKDMEEYNGNGQWFNIKYKCLNSGSVIDWRSPIASMYYENNLNVLEFKYSTRLNDAHKDDIQYSDILSKVYRGEDIRYTHKLLLKRRFSTEEGQNFNPENFNDSFTGKTDITFSISNDPFLLRVLESKRNLKSPTDIIETIAKNQYSIIKASPNENFVVQGCAGSGKTAVLLSRLSYIIYNYYLKQNNIYIITPSENFNKHIEPLIKKYELGSIFCLSKNDFFGYILSNKFNIETNLISDEDTILPENFDNKLRSIIFDYKKAISKRYIQESRLLNSNFGYVIDKEPNESLTIEECENLIKQNIEKYKKEIERIRNKIKIYKKANKDLNDTISYVIDKTTDLDNNEFSKKLSNLKRNSKKNFYDYFKQINALLNLNDIEDPIEKYKRLDEIAKDFYTNKFIINESKYNVVTKFKNENLENLKIKDDIKINKFIGNTEGLDSLEKMTNNIYTYYSFRKTCKFVNEKLKISKSEFPHNNCFYLYVAKYHYGKISEPQYLFIDEAQEWSKDEYHIINDIFEENPVFNLFGDLRQTTRKIGLKNWNAVPFEYKEYFLNENYRNTNEITEYCNENFNMDMMPIGLTGVPVSKISVENLQNSISKLDKNERIAIISNDQVFNDYLNDHYSLENIKIYNVEEVKGIEFDTCYVNLNNLNNNEKYIACTRPLKQLNIVS